MKGVRRESDEMLDGAVVQWSKKRKKVGNQYHVQVVYDCCGKKRWCSPSSVGELRERDKVWCISCRPRNFKRPATKEAIIMNGRRFLHIDFLSKSEKKMAMKMRLANGAYIAEHRLRAALKIGRPLKQRDSVHHHDGDPLNNKDENLFVVPQSIHKMTHWEVVRELCRYQEQFGELAGR